MAFGGSAAEADASPRRRRQNVETGKYVAATRRSGVKRPEFLVTVFFVWIPVVVARPIPNVLLLRLCCGLIKQNLIAYFVGWGQLVNITFVNLVDFRRRGQRFFVTKFT